MMATTAILMDRALDILHKHNIQSFILKAGDSVHDHPNDISPNMKLNNLYGNARMNWMRHNRTFNFSPPHMNSALVETWVAFKLSYATINHKYFKRTNNPPSHPQESLMVCANL